MNAFSEHLSDQFERLAAATGGAETGVDAGGAGTSDGLPRQPGPAKP